VEGKSKATVKVGTSTVVAEADAVTVTVGGATLTVKDGEITLSAGGATLKVSGSGVDITGDSVTHAGKNIGKDHKHTRPSGHGRQSGRLNKATGTVPNCARAPHSAKMAGMDRITGKPLSGWDHVAQSLAFFSPPRRLRASCAATWAPTSPALVDAPMSPATLIDFYAGAAEAIDAFEPRFKVTRFGTVDGHRGWPPLH
jgi:phage baseplate assembly protein W